MYIVICFKYPGASALSGLIDSFEVACRTADLQRALNKDYEQDISVHAIGKDLYHGKSETTSKEK